MGTVPFIEIAEHLELAGLIWQPEIGDEVSKRAQRASVSILVDPQGMTPTELRSTFLWLPTVEQIVLQFESRQAILFHAGLELSNYSMLYKTVVQKRDEQIEQKGESLRIAMGLALRDLLLIDNQAAVN
ncbi:MAG: hypothetical protein K1X83_05505 [Oligoflexia bacterium]|nr:hypothetical protein [Oligoflexia bacterium]